MRRRSPAFDLSGLERGGNAVETIDVLDLVPVGDPCRRSTRDLRHLTPRELERELRRPRPPGARPTGVGAVISCIEISLFLYYCL